MRIGALEAAPQVRRMQPGRPLLHKRHRCPAHTNCCRWSRARPLCCPGASSLRQPAALCSRPPRRPAAARLPASAAWRWRPARPAHVRRPTVGGTCARWQLWPCGVLRSSTPAVLSKRMATAITALPCPPPCARSHAWRQPAAAHRALRRAPPAQRQPAGGGGGCLARGPACHEHPGSAGHDWPGGLSWLGFDGAD